MLRLTLRAAIDGRMLARVMDRGGMPFVLDFGDHAVIREVREHLQHGFALQRFGELVNVRPHAPDLLARLADLYAASGRLVFLDEPTWPGRAPQGLLLPSLPPPDSALLEDFDTEIVDEDDLPDVGDALKTLIPENADTAEVPLPAPRRRPLDLPPVLFDVPDVGDALRTVYPDDELDD